jgi:uncharacterized membrane protein
MYAVAMSDHPTGPGATNAREEERETARIEAFSDGVFAIAITLLILEIKVPHGDGGQALAAGLLRAWPSYLAFITSFFCIGVMWINHHKLFTLIGRADHMLLVWNGVLLLGVTVVPFPTAVLAEHFVGDGARVAAALYNGWFIVVALMFTRLWSHASHGRRLLRRRVTELDIATVNSQYRFGWLTYGVIFLLGFVYVPASIALNLALAIWFGLPPEWFERKAARRGGAE